MRRIVFPILGLLLLQQQDVSLRLEHGTPPAHPLGTLATGVSVVEVEVDGRTGAQQTRSLYGKSPFVTPGLNALMGWGFAVPPGTDIARTSVTFLFRSPVIYAVNLPAPAIKPWGRGLDTSALPKEIVDPGYPVTSVAEGVVILAARITTEGIVIGVEKVSGDATLFEQSQLALKSWKFSPARISNKAVNSTAYVVISFVRPT